jgi:hypothetical protein
LTIFREMNTKNSDLNRYKMRTQHSFALSRQ